MFCMETRLSNIFETKNVTNLTKLILESSYRVLKVTFKWKTLKQPVYFLKAVEFQSYHFPFRVIIGHININSIRNKFEPLVSFLSNNLDILMISETKTDDTFPDFQFLIKGFLLPYRLDRAAKGGGILLYIRDNIPSKRIKNVTFDESLLGDFNVEVEEKNLSNLMSAHNLKTLIKYLKKKPLKTQHV